MSVVLAQGSHSCPAPEDVKPHHSYGSKIRRAENSSINLELEIEHGSQHNWEGYSNPELLSSTPPSALICTSTHLPWGHAARKTIKTSFYLIEE